MSDLFSGIHFNAINFEMVIGFVVFTILIIISSLISGSEVAFFSLSPSDKKDIEGTKNGHSIIRLLTDPERLLATILISNNFVNVGIIILSSYLTIQLVDFSGHPLFGFIFQIVIVTFLLLLFGEILPKIYASIAPKSFSFFMANPINFLQKLLYPFSQLLLKSSVIVNKAFNHVDSDISINELSMALDITGKDVDQDREILEGIVKYGNTYVKEIMTPRIDVVTADISYGFFKIKSIIIEESFSRIPVYEDNLDNVRGILFVKDLLPYLEEGDDFNWQQFLRSPYFVPESKKINDLLQEFKKEKKHLAIIVDEYGGAFGIVTMEDIIEEILGEIEDETDEVNKHYTKIDANTYLFDAKTYLNDFCRIMDVDFSIFDKIRGDAETIAGLILEIKGEIPRKLERVVCKPFVFTIETVDNRRIKEVKITKETKYFENIK